MESAENSRKTSRQKLSKPKLLLFLQKIILKIEKDILNKIAVKNAPKVVRQNIYKIKNPSR